MCISTGKSCDCPTQLKLDLLLTLAYFQNGGLSTIATEQRLTFKSEKSITYLDNATPYSFNPKM